MDELEQAINGVTARRRAAEALPEPQRTAILVFLDHQEAELQAMQDMTEAST